MVDSLAIVTSSFELHTLTRIFSIVRLTCMVIRAFVLTSTTPTTLTTDSLERQLLVVTFLDCFVVSTT